MEEKPDYLEHRKRLRERFEKAGGKGLHDYELLELVLTYAVPRVDVKPVAKALIKRFGGVSGVMDASLDDLQSVKGLGPASAILIRVVKELFDAYLAEGARERSVL